MSVVFSWLAEVRDDPRARWSATIAGVVVGLAVARVHWYGFVLGGALVGLFATDLRRGFVRGVGFGLVSLVAFAGLLAAHGTLVPSLAMGQVTAVGAAIPVVGAALGSLIRGAV